MGRGDSGRAMLANVTPSAGYEIWAVEQKGAENGRLRGVLYNVYGEVVNTKTPSVQTWSSYWDGDLLSELPNTTPAGGGDKSGRPVGVHKYNWETGATETIATFAGTWTNNSSKNNPCLTADILGDWREEILVRSTDNEELRIYVTNLPTDYTIYNLMQDSVYRNAVANQNSSYNQPAHTSFYLGEDEAGRERVLNFELPVYEYAYTTEGAAKYTDISFVTNKDVTVDALTQVKLGSTITAPTVTVEGDTLEGWYLDEALTRKWDFAEDTVAGSMTLYAKWTTDADNDNEASAQYTVILTSMLADGTTSVAALEGGGIFDKGTENVLKAPAKDGYSFLGWYEDSYAAANKFSGNLEYTFTVEENVNLVAVYQANGNATLAIEGSDFTVNGVESEGSYSAQYSIGSEIKLAALGENFLYWKNSAGRIVSTSAEYTLTLLGNVNLVTVYNEDGNGSALVEFVTDYGQVLQAGTWTADSAGSLPATIPSKLGYQFTGWDMTVDDILAKIAAGETYITVKPQYQSIEAIYNVTVIYDGNEAEAVTESKAVATTMTVNAQTVEGKKFSHWADSASNGNVLSTNESYTFYVVGDTTIYAIYVAEITEVEKVPAIAVTGITASNVSEKKKITFHISRAVPEGYELLEHGVVYDKSGVAHTEEDMVIDNADISKYTAKGKASQGIFNANISVSNEETILCVRGYMTVCNKATGNIETIYSQMASASYSELTAQSN